MRLTLSRTLGAFGSTLSPFDLGPGHEFVDMPSRRKNPRTWRFRESGAARHVGRRRHASRRIRYGGHGIKRPSVARRGGAGRGKRAPCLFKTTGPDLERRLRRLAVQRRGFRYLKVRQGGPVLHRIGGDDASVPSRIVSHVGRQGHPVSAAVPEPALKRYRMRVPATALSAWRTSMTCARSLPAQNMQAPFYETIRRRPSLQR